VAKLTALLTGMLLTCALLLVTSQHQARKAFIDLERAQATARKHEVEWNQLQLEQTRLAKHSLIDAVARRDLRMQPVTPERTLYVAAPPGLSVSVPPVPSAGNGAAPGSSARVPARPAAGSPVAPVTPVAPLAPSQLAAREAR
jgi:cell division protein FtsL